MVFVTLFTSIGSALKWAGEAFNPFFTMNITIYKSTYQLAIDLHNAVIEGGEFKENEAEQIKTLARSALASVAEAYSQSPTKAKRFYFYKAMDSLRTLGMDVEYLMEMGRFEGGKVFYDRVEKLARDIYSQNLRLLRGGGTELTREDRRSIRSYKLKS